MGLSSLDTRDGGECRSVSTHRGPEYADQAVTGRSRGVCWDRLFDAQGRSYTFLEHFKLEMLGRELGLISGSLVGRKPAER